MLVFYMNRIDLIHKAKIRANFNKININNNNNRYKFKIRKYLFLKTIFKINNNNSNRLFIKILLINWKILKNRYFYRVNNSLFINNKF